MAVIPTAWNPADKAAGVVLTGGNLTASCGASESVRSTFGATAGKYYWELTYPSGVTGMAGVATSASDIDNWPGADAAAWAAESTTGDIYTNSGITASSSVGGPTTTLSVLLDATAKTLKFWADGVDFGVTITLTGSQFYAVTGYSGTITANFGATAFNHTPPAGYEAGLGVLDPNTTVIAGSALAFSAGAPTAVRGPNRTVQAGSALVFSAGTPGATTPDSEAVFPVGVAAFAAGAPTAVRGPNRTVQAGSTLVSYAGTPEAKTPVSEVVFPTGVAVFAAGAPTAVRGPNRTAQAEGALVFESGEPAAQLGYPATIEPAGVAAFAAGQPTAFPWSHRTVRPRGVYAVASGSPMALRGMPPANTMLTALGTRAFASGTPSARNTVAVQAQGSAVFAAGEPQAYPILRAQGVCVASAGTPKALARLRVAGSCVFYAGVPSARTTAHVQGICVVRAGVPTADASAVAQGQGVLAFYSGVPRISGVTVRPRTTLCFRSGTPTINRGATC